MNSEPLLSLRASSLQVIGTCPICTSFDVFLNRQLTTKQPTRCRIPLPKVLCVLLANLSENSNSCAKRDLNMPLAWKSLRAVLAGQNWQPMLSPALPSGLPATKRSGFDKARLSKRAGPGVQATTRLDNDHKSRLASLSSLGGCFEQPEIKSHCQLMAFDKERVSLHTSRLLDDQEQRQCGERRRATTGIIVGDLLANKVTANL